MIRQIVHDMIPDLSKNRLMLVEKKAPVCLLSGRCLQLAFKSIK